SVYAKAGPNFSGEVQLEVEYVVTDPSQDGTLPAVNSATQTGTHTLVVGAVTDGASADIGSIDVTAGTAIDGTAELTAPGTVTVNVTIGKVADPQAGGASDHDGSEALTHIVVRGVPDGVVVQGATMVGEGEWLLATTDAF